MLTRTLDWVSDEAGFAAARLDEIVQAALPEFVLIRDCVIRDRPGVREGFEHWWELHREEPWAIESVMNHVHLYDLVDESYDDTELGLLEQTAHRIANSWRAKLQHDFPDRSFEVTFATEPDEYGPTVSCFQTPPNLGA